MSEGRSQSSRSLTGVWQGIYSYPGRSHEASARSTNPASAAITLR
jgi:hypothetical protein